MSYITWTHEMTEFKVVSIKDYDPDPINGQTYKTRVLVRCLGSQVRMNE